MNVKPHDFKLFNLLSNPTEQFIVPSYQRRYAWGRPQQEALFKDIDMLLPNDGHLFGMLILHAGNHHGGLNTVDVVDGQQRLTTTTILLLALRDELENQKIEHLVTDIDRLLFCHDPSGKKKRKLMLGQLDDVDLQHLFDDKFEKVKNLRLVHAYEFFRETITDRIKEKGAAWLTEFYQKLLHTATIIRLDVPQAKDAYKLFETINNRGLRLSATDILKNFILGHASKLGEEKLKDARESWAELITNLDGINSDVFFRQYVSSLYQRKISNTKLVEEFKKHYFKHVADVDRLGEFQYDYGSDNFDEEDEDLLEEHIEEELDDQDEDIATERIDILDYLQNIVNATNCYKRIVFANFGDAKLDQQLRDLKAIRSLPTYIFLMHFLQNENLPRKTKLKILEIITATILRRHVCGRSTAYNDNIFARLLRIDPYSEDYLKQIKQSLIEDYPEDDEFLDKFDTHELKERLIDRARYMLSKIEYHITGNTSELHIGSTEDVHVEHIIPKKITTRKSVKEFGDWMEYLSGNVKLEHKKRVNRIGNMTLFSGTMNIKVSNNPFHSKRKEYRKSNIQLTKDLGEYGYFKFRNLDNRGRQLAEHAVKIWRF